MNIPISEQVKLLKKCISGQLDLEEEFRAREISYDDLRYRHNGWDSELFPDQSLSGSFIEIEECQENNHGIPTVSFFSGCGGLDLGFEYAGFTNLAAIEKNEVFCETLRQNACVQKVIGPPLFSGDARNRDEIVRLLRTEAGLVKGQFPGVFYGGPPCQSFSIAANQRFSKNGENFKRIGFSHHDYGTLLFDYVYYITIFRPEVFLIENVAGLLTVDDGDQLSDALSELRSAGYVINDPAVLNAVDYQVPQNRLRVFIVGSRRNSVLIFPIPNPAKVSCGKVFAKPVAEAPNHITRKHKAESVLRYMELHYGQRDPLGRVDRLDPRLPSKTVIAGGSNGGGRSHLHPFIPRTLSVRESARLQTFPDSYVFKGTPARQFTQVGNAVPPLLAFHLATSIYQQCFLKRS